MNLSEQAERALKIVRECKVLGYDTETSGLNPRANSIVGYVITADEENNFYIPVRHGGGGNLIGTKPLENADDEVDVHPFELELARAFDERRNKSLLTVGHNLKFDALFSLKQGINIGRDLYDTNIVECLLDEHAKSYSLDISAKRRGAIAKLGDDLYQYISELTGCKAERSAMSNFWLTNGQNEHVIDYSCGDGISTLDLREKQLPIIEEDGIQQIVDIENQLIRTLVKMEARGVKIDMEQLDRVKYEANQHLVNAEASIPAGLNVRSGKQMKEYMESIGVTNWPTTPKGNPSFTEKFLLQSEAGQNIVAARKWKTVISQFINPMIDHHVINGRVHPSFNQLKIGDFGTITGRFSCSNPNLQQVPKRDKVTAKLYRSIFVADDGMDFYEADYSQCEPRLFAHYSDDEALVEGYNSNPPKDMHSVVAELMDVERDPKAKRMNMGILTGMQKRTFADHMEMPVSEAGPLWEQWYENFTGIKKLQDDCKHTMLKVGYIRTILGRKCRLDSARYAYKGTSRLIQGGNADIMKKKMLDADLMCEESGLAEILLTVHDSVGFQAGKDEKSKDFVQAMLAMMSDVQCEPYNLKVPFVMDVGFGANWSIATFGD